MRMGPESQVVHQAHYTDLKKCEEGRQFWNLFTLFSEVLQLLFLTKTPPPFCYSKLLHTKLRKSALMVDFIIF